MQTSLSCKLCGAESRRLHVAREMMLGTRHTFTYLECPGCGSVRIAEVPSNLADYYPQNYTAYLTGAMSAGKARLRQLLVAAATRSPLFCKAAAPFHRFKTAELIHAMRLRPSMEILDVGCGSGWLVRDLRSAGFHATGIDRFAPVTRDVSHPVVQRGELQTIDQSFDCILFNHSLEHIEDQVGTLRLAREKLRPAGVCLVRIPLAAWAWEHYGTDWVQLDAPRHLFIHSERSLRLAAEQAGLTVADTVFDSFDFQFWGSELYRLDVPLEEGRLKLAEYFTEPQMKEFTERAEELNRLRQGDQAMFFLRAA